MIKAVVMVNFRLASLNSYHLVRAERGEHGMLRAVILYAVMVIASEERRALKALAVRP